MLFSVFSLQYIYYYWWSIIARFYEHYYIRKWVSITSPANFSWILYWSRKILLRAAIPHKCSYMHSIDCSISNRSNTLCVPPTCLWNV